MKIIFGFSSSSNLHSTKTLPQLKLLTFQYLHRPTSLHDQKKELLLSLSPQVHSSSILVLLTC